MRPVRNILMLGMLTLIICSGVAIAQDNGIDPEAIIERILHADKEWHVAVKDVVFDAEYISGERKDDGTYEEKTRFEKKIYMKVLADTTLLHEEYLAYYKDGVKQSDKDLRKAAEEQIKKKKKRKGRDISYPILTPFYPEHRAEYEIEYVGVPAEPINGMVCHQFKVTAKEEDPLRMNGDYYFDANTFNLAQVDFSPSKKGGAFGFSIKNLDMTIMYGPSADGFWLPQQFDIYLKAKAILFIPVTVHGTEYYRNPIVNGGIDDSMFEDNDDD